MTTSHDQVMDDAANSNHILFDGGPLVRWERTLGLAKPGHQLILRRSFPAVVIGWLPLAILAAGQFVFSGDELARTFFADFGVHARFLVAVPALILAEAECIPRLGRIVDQFARTGLIVEADTARFQAAVSSTKRMLDSTIGDVVTIVLVYAVVATIALYFSMDAWPAWHHRKPPDATRLSPAGWWHSVVSLPILLILLFDWFWRLALWARFLFLMSRLKLHLIPGHPDRVGGLKFVSSSLRGFRLISFALGAIVAGAIANNQVHHGIDPFEFRNLVIGLLVFLMILFAGPLAIFLGKLRRTKTAGVFEYGALARIVGTQFEAKWLRQKQSLDEKALGVQDFSATTDLYSIAANVHAMREVPFTLKDLVGPIVVSALIPMLPVALIAVPMKVILQGLAKLLF